MAAGRFAPGHLGELTGVVPFELVDAVLAETRTVQRRLRDLEAVLYTTEPLRNLPAGVEQTEFPHANKESFRSVTSGRVSSSNQTADCSGTRTVGGREQPNPRRPVRRHHSDRPHRGVTYEVHMGG
ncbi:transposase domain-containing protein [Streptomyces cadmiisoli]|uniref:transposase domain-containing protein n=1 Tax=Streptomyces cadmiisoli TaxID=2184053 RepID=UPI00365E27D9